MMTIADRLETKALQARKRARGNFGLTMLIGVGILSLFPFAGRPLTFDDDAWCASTRENATQQGGLALLCPPGTPPRKRWLGLLNDLDDGAHIAKLASSRASLRLADNK